MSLFVRIGTENTRKSLGMQRIDRSFTLTEKLVHAVARGVNERAALKRWSHVFLRTAGASWVRWCSRNLVRLTNVEVRATIAPTRGVVIPSNHRSYFDMYLLSSVLLPRCRWIERMYFPVRSEFFYDQLGGLMVNACVAGMAMYPPVYRQPSRRALNRETLTFLVKELDRPGTLIGMHPEGQRNKGADPYTLLPAQPGLGEIVHRAQPIVLPVFITGVPRSVWDGVRANFRRDDVVETINVTFGNPLVFEHYRGVDPGPRTSLRIAEETRSEIERLGAHDRRMRAPRSA